MTKLTDIKKAIHDHCAAFVQQRIDNARKAMEAAQEAANEESKSSAGDKYETGRAMMQLERDRYAAQLAEAMALQKQLSLIQIEKSHEVVQPGSLVYTSQGNYFIAISAGKVVVDQQDFIAVSLASPIGNQLHRHKAGDELFFNNKSLKIEKVI